ncbi:glycosyltransferase family 25 protein [Aquamicrobium segne]|uniref:Glycosyltransferase family 25 protein n=1 Tax=Aquamicrobium segne TaxID=469547 RepID=A0ABW0GXM4_9HYPH
MQIDWRWKSLVRWLINLKIFPPCAVVKELQIPIVLINLDRSVDRLAAIEESAAQFGLSISRIPAVDGRILTEEQRKIIDLRRFHAFNGRHVMPSEIGCYLSHIKAWHVIANGAAPFGVVLEDDVRFTEDFKPVIMALAEADGWGIVKLVNHRARGFIRAQRLSNGYALGRCLHGPLGSSAAYAISRQAAGRLLETISDMVVPVDVELERGWAHGAKFYTLDRPVVRLSGAKSTVTADVGSYRTTKFPFYRRWRTLIYRAVNYAQRVIYAASR